MNLDLITAAVAAIKKIDDLNKEVANLNSQLKDALNQLDEQNDQLNQWEKLGENPSKVWGTLNELRDAEKAARSKDTHLIVEALVLLEEVAKTPALTLRQATMDKVKKFVADNMPF